MAFIHTLMLYIGSGILAFLTCLWIVPGLISFANNRQWFDVPDERKVHAIPIPRLGGVAVCTATLAGLLLQQYYYYSTDPAAQHFFISYLIPALCVFTLGLLDDLFSVAAPLKLFVQILIASYVFFDGVQVFSLLGYELSPLVNYLFTVFWIILFTNAYNLIDGFDGVASGLGIIAAIGIGGSLMLRGLYTEALFLLPLIGAAAGFLRYNRSPATIFLGDSGSLFIGFTLSWISLATLSKSPALASVLVPFLAFGVPFFDVFLAVWRRSVRKYFFRILDRPVPVGVMEADREHVHHRLNNAGQSPRNVAALLYLLNCIFVCIGITSLLYSEIALGLYVLLFFLMSFLFIRYIGKIELSESRVVLRYGFSHSIEIVKINGWLAIIEFISLSSVLLIAIWATYHWYRPPAELFNLWKIEVLPWVLPVITGTSALRMYYYVKNYYAYPSRMLAVDCLFVVVLLGCVASIVTVGFSQERIQASYYFSLSAFTLIIIRLIRFTYVERA